jgi:hypothetical protein
MPETRATAPLPPRLAELLDSIESVRADTVRIVREAAVAPEAARAPGEWSPGELLEHLLLAEVGAGKVVRKVIRESGAALPPYPSDDSGIRIRQPISFDGMESPPSARPGGAMTRDALLSKASEVRAMTRETIGLLSSVDPRAGSFPHHRFGPLDLYEWLAVVILEHEKSHRGQLRAAAAAEGGRP